jgi:hypothetical protein
LFQNSQVHPLLNSTNKIAQTERDKIAGVVITASLSFNKSCAILALTRYQDRH